MNKSHPPYWAKSFFKWYCDSRLQESIMGDMEEQFEEDKINFGAGKARRRFVWSVLRFFRKGIIKPVCNSQNINYYSMFKHNLLITFRGFLRHRTTFGINLLGLTVSITCVIFISLWINDELKKDRFHDDSDNLFQVYSRFNNSDGVSVWHGVSGLIETEIEAQIPQVKLSAVSTDVHEYTLSVDNQGFKAKGRFADEDYLKILNYPLWKGEKEALAEPSNILITKSLAKRIFGKEEVIGETINWHFWNDQKTFRVAGILEDLTSATSEPFNFILPWSFYHDELINFKGWGNYYGRVIVKLDKRSQKERIEKNINEIFKSNQSGKQVELFLTNYADRYLYGKYENGQQAGGRVDYVYLAVAVAIFILLIACINFINLSTAFATLKAKEIGIKKSLGATKGQLAFQFFLESILLSVMAVSIALLVIVILLEPFNQLSGKQLVFNFDLRLFSAALLFIPSIGLIAGLYPALHLSRLKVISALKAKATTRQMNGVWSRKALVFVQFTLSIILMVGTLIVSRQMDYVLDKNLGYDRDNLLYFLKEGNILDNSEAFIAELENITGVTLVSQSGFSVIPGFQNRTASISWDGKEKDQRVSFWENNGDAKSVDILGLELIEGRSFDAKLNTEENSIIFNETAIQIMGLENPIGEMVTHYTGKKEIIGVVKDFTTESLHHPMEPAMFHHRPEQAHYIMLKIENGKELQTIKKIESVYKKYNTNYPFDPRFVDQDYQAMYDSEMRVSKLSRLFSALAILISCMGLLGLTIFQVQRRVKEIGIKKVLGCSSWKLALSMTFDFTKSVFIALIFALPISYLLGIKWLENFAESIELSLSMFISAAFLAILIAWLTVGTQTWKAANANPVHSLRNE